jgi:hypothetical protein
MALLAAMAAGCSGPQAWWYGPLARTTQVVVIDPWGARTVIRQPYQVHNLIEMAVRPDFVNQGPVPCDGPLYRMIFKDKNRVLAVVRTDGEGCLYLHRVG